MNEKIKELAKQAGYATEIHLSPRQGGATEEHIWGGAMETKKVERFVELIINECANEASDWYESRGLYGFDVFAKHIKGKFGIK